MISAMIEKAFSTATRTLRSEPWDIGDEVIALRAWGNEDHIYFPSSSEWTIGSSASCDLRLDAPGVSRQHASMTRMGTHWHIHDRASKNGVIVDGRRASSARVEPGAVLILGHLRLVAMSCRLTKLRELLFCIMGWRPEIGTLVDETMQDLRFALLRRDPIVLSGRHTVALAQQMAAILLGPDRPFAFHSAKLNDSERGGDVRWFPNAKNLDAAIEMAKGGAVGLHGTPLPQELVSTVIQLRTWHERPPVIFICEEGKLDLRIVRMAPPILVPELRERSIEELEYVVSKSLFALSREWGTELDLPEHVRHWAIENAETVPDLQKCLRRVMALRKAGTLLGASKLLGIATVSLRRWFHRHPLPRAQHRKKKGGPR